MAYLFLDIRRPRAAASLKQLPEKDPLPNEHQYPPPSGGGLIEAGYMTKQSTHTTQYPPPSGGGLIEAGYILERIFADGGYPPPSGGGLIEAQQAMFDAANGAGYIRRPRAAASLKHKGHHGSDDRRRGYPPPSGGGLIEATDSGTATTEPARISAALGRRPH